MGDIINIDGTNAVADEDARKMEGIFDVMAALKELYAMKDTMPEQWALARSIQLEEAIIEFNDHADQYGLDCIVAFRCTPEERDAIIANMVIDTEEVLEDGTDVETDNREDG